MNVEPLVPAKLSLAVQPSSRDSAANKDDYLINGYIEKLVDDGVQVFKRPGTTLATYNGSGNTGAAHGFHYSLRGYTHIIIGITFYIAELGYSASISTQTGYRASFDDFGGASPGTFIQSTPNSFYYTGTNGTVLVPTAAPNANLSLYVPGVVFLDGTLYMMGNQGSIFGSAINDPTTWSALNVIQGSATGELGIALAKQKVYVIAFNQFSTHVFFDNANSTGSPLSPLPGGTSRVGCFDANSLQTMGDELVWVGAIAGGMIGVYMMRDLAITKVSTGAIDRIISLPQGAAAPSYVSFQMAIAGHRFYGLSVQGQTFSLLYDLETGIWTEWSTYFDGILPWVSSGEAPAFPCLVQSLTDGRLYRIDESLYRDDDGIFAVTIVTDNWDGGTRFDKTLVRMDFVGDQVSNSTMAVSHSEDDYQTFSTPRTVDLSLRQPQLMNCGTFSKRAWKFVHRANVPFRIEDVYMALQMGSR